MARSVGRKDTFLWSYRAAVQLFPAITKRGEASHGALVGVFSNPPCFFRGFFEFLSFFIFSFRSVWPFEDPNLAGRFVKCVAERFMCLERVIQWIMASLRGEDKLRLDDLQQGYEEDAGSYYRYEAFHPNHVCFLILIFAFSTPTIEILYFHSKNTKNPTGSLQQSKIVVEMSRRSVCFARYQLFSLSPPGASGPEDV